MAIWSFAVKRRLSPLGLRRQILLPEEFSNLLRRHNLNPTIKKGSRGSLF